MGIEKMNLEGSMCDIMGIDLGTTNSAVSVYDASLVPYTLPIGELGRKTVPSCVLWEGGDKFIVGAEAYRKRYLPSVCYSVKRLMGTDQLVKLTAENGEVRLFQPKEISAEILRYLALKVAECYRPIKKCIITVPAYFNQRQISDTADAASIAGMECIQILKEPTSASYIYSMLGYAQTGSILIYDLGGGTFDVTHMKFVRRDSIPSKMVTSLKKRYGIDVDALNPEQKYFCKVLGTYGDTHLGGDDIDEEMARQLDPKRELSAEDFERLILRCESFKKQAAYAMDVDLNGKMYHITEDLLNSAVDHVFDKTIELFKDIDMSLVKTIVLVGGSTKSKRIRDNLSRVYPHIEISAVLNPDETVALGAGAVAKAIANCENLSYQDVLPLSIGILVDDKQVEYCIKRNTPMPYAVTRTFYTMNDNQKAIDLSLYQGLSRDPKECTFIGNVHIDNIPEKEAGEVSVNVSFTLNAQGRLAIVSIVDGMATKHELVIDNIFNVKKQETAEQKYADEFEEAMMPLAEGNPEFLKLFEERRNAKSDTEREEIENKIAEMAMA